MALLPLRDSQPYWFRSQGNGGAIDADSITASSSSFTLCKANIVREPF